MAIALMLAAVLAGSSSESAAPDLPAEWCRRTEAGHYLWLHRWSEREPATGNPERIIPSFENGAPVGAKIFGKLLAGCGVQPGDVVTAIDGRPVAGEDPYLALQRRVVSERRATLTFLRRGRRLHAQIDAPPLCTKVSDALYRVDTAAFAEYEAARGTTCDIDYREHVSPAKRGGRTIGARVWLSRQSIYRGCGLMPGDIVLEADGAPMTSPDSSLRAYQAARAAGRIQFVLLRRGKRVQVALEASTLSETRSGH